MSEPGLLAATEVVTEPPPASEWLPVRHVSAGLRVGEMISTLGALALALSMVLMPWYGGATTTHVAGGRGSSIAAPVGTSVMAFSALPVVRWPVVATVGLALATALLHGLERRWGRRSPIAPGLVLLAGATALLLAYRTLVAPPEPASIIDLELGGYLALLAAVAVFLGALESLREEREARFGGLRRDEPGPEQAASSAAAPS